MKQFKVFFDVEICKNIPLFFEAENSQEALEKAQSLSSEEKNKQFLDFYKDDDEFLSELLDNASLSINTYYEPEKRVKQ